MAVTPVQIPVSTSVPTLTLAAGSAGGIAVASTIDPVNDYLGIYTASATATQGINRNTLLGITGNPVGTTDSQTLTNKTLTSPVINGATLSGTLSGTYTIGGTPTFPTSVVTLTGTQTLTNKTLTSSTINSPTITNAIISADAITGYTTSNSGTIYGVSVTSGQITGAGSIGAGALATNSVTGSNLATNAITLGSVSITGTPSTSSTSATLITGLTVSAMVPTGGRKIEIDLSFYGLTQASGTSGRVYIYRGATSGTLTTLIQDFFIGSGIVQNTFIATDSPTAGTYFYSAAYNTSNGSDPISLTVGSGNSGTIWVKAI